MVVERQKEQRDTLGICRLRLNAEFPDPGDFSLKSLLNLIDCKNNLAVVAA